MGGDEEMSETLKLTSHRDLMHQQMLLKIRFNRYDMKFMQNILAKYILQGTALSTRQNELYEKLIHKYRKQFRKLGVNYKDILATPWQHDVITTEQLDTQTFFKVEGTGDDSIMQMYFNFNKAHIDEIRTLIHDDACNHLNKGSSESGQFGGDKYDFVWNNKTNVWIGPFNVYLFRQLYRFANKHNIQIDSSARTIFERMSKKYGLAETWQPHLHISNGRMYVSQLTETMLPFLKDIDMTDISIQNVERLVKLGLKSPDKFDDINQYVNSFSHGTPHTISSMADFDTLQEYIAQTNRKVLFYQVGAFFRARGSHGVLEKALIEWDNPNILHIGNQSTIDLSNVEAWIEEGYDTLITTHPVSNLLFSQSNLGAFALSSKVIYIKIQESTSP